MVNQFLGIIVYININFIVIDSFDKVIKYNKSKYEILHNLKFLPDVKNIGIFVISK